MKKLYLNLILRAAVLTMLALPQIVSAQFFRYSQNQYGDVLMGFRKTGVNAGNYELVVDIGNVTNLLNMSAGSSMTISQLSPRQLTNAFPNGFGFLQWSAFTAFPGSISSWQTPLGAFPAYTIWYTLPASDVNSQTVPPQRDAGSSQRPNQNLIIGVGVNASFISQSLGVTNENNNAFLVREPIATYADRILSDFIADYQDPTIGDFGASFAPLPQPVENVTPASFNSPQRCDFYQVCPTGKTDPVSGTASGEGYFVGYFILNPNGTMTFTRAGGTAAAPVAAFASAPASGFAPLQVAFSDSSTGNITNWIWSFGDGQSVTNVTGGIVNHTYAAAGTYSVALTVSGPGGTDTKAETASITALSAPTIGIAVTSGGNFVFSGANAPAGAQYRILTATNLAAPLANWRPVATNTFSGNGSFAYTNSALANGNAFFRLVSP